MTRSPSSSVSAPRATGGVFASFRHVATGAEKGAAAFGWPDAPPAEEDRVEPDEPPVVATAVDY